MVCCYVSYKDTQIRFGVWPLVPMVSCWLQVVPTLLYDYGMSTMVHSCAHCRHIQIKYELLPSMPMGPCWLLAPREIIQPAYGDCRKNENPNILLISIGLRKQ